MKRIIKTHTYQLLHNRSMHLMFAVIVLLVAAMGFLSEGGSTDDVPPSACHFILNNMNAFMNMPYLFFGYAIGMICAGDFGDKTLYIELLSGVRRHQLVLGRGAVAIIYSFLCSVVITLTPVIVATLAFGWGEYFTVQDFLLRWIISLFPLLRGICAFVTLAFLLKNHYIMMALGFCVMMSSLSLGVLLREAPQALLSCTSLAKLCSFDIWQVFTMGDEVHLVVETAIPSGVTASIIFGSLIASALYLFLGCAIFRGDDMN